MIASQEQSGLAGALPDGYKSWWLEVAGHLGGVYPFVDTHEPDRFSLEISTIIQSRRARGEIVELDPSALVTKASLPFVLGNRTMLKGVRRAPWMSLPSRDGGWREAPLPPHGMVSPSSPDSFVSELRAALLNEAERYVNGARTVGILLSGGMDSRVVAGIVRAVQETSDNAFDVVGLTWGSEASRDVVYARRITDRFGWEWKHYPITVETLFSNISHMAKMGAEVAPLHLHAMPQMAATKGLDVVLAGSYGDSVGRGEFSGRRLSQLKSILPKRFDRFGVLRHEAKKAAFVELQADVTDGSHFRESTTLRRREIEQEMHYMRRMLQSCMMCIAQEMRFFQFFTAPEVFGLMWSLDPKVRGDQWYARLLSLLPGNLLEIPWARTGRRYNEMNSQADDLSSSYHSYGHWLRQDLRKEVLARANSSRIRELGIFNDAGLDSAFRAWARATTRTTNALDDLVSWMASLDEFIEEYNLDGVSNDYAPNTRDRLAAFRGGMLASLYVAARDRMRN